MPDVVDTWDVLNPPTSGNPTLGLQLRRSAGLRSRNMGSEAAFSELYRRHHQELYRYCLSILRHEQDAQDALQNTIVKAHRALAKEERDFELRPWLFRVAHNECISLVRKRRETTELSEQVPETTTTETRHAEREELRQLEADLAKLPERQRSALVLRELSGLSHEEIAAVLEVSSAVVKSTIFEARTTLLQFREGRDMACSTVRAALSDGDKRVLRGRKQRAHLGDCASCRAFQAGLLARPGQLAALAPPLPAAAVAAMLHQLLPGAAAVAGSGAAGVGVGVGAGSAGLAGSTATGAGAGSAGLAGLTASGVSSSVLGGVTAKLAAGAAVAALAAGGTAVVTSDQPAARTASPRQDERRAAPRPATPLGALPGSAATGAPRQGGPADAATAAALARRKPGRGKGATGGTPLLPAGSRGGAGSGGASALRRKDAAAGAARAGRAAKKLLEGRRAKARPSVRRDEPRGGSAPVKAPGGRATTPKPDRAGGTSKAPAPAPSAGTTRTIPAPAGSTRPPARKAPGAPGGRADTAPPLAP